MAITTKDFKLELSEIVNNFLWNTQQASNQTETFTQINNLNSVRQRIQEIGELGIFTDRVNNLLTSELFTLPGNIINFSINKGIDIDNQLTQLRSLVKEFYNALLKTIPPEDPNSINIKIPPSVRDFGDLEKIAHDLHIALSQVLLLKGIEGQETIVSVDNGSIWFNVFVGGPTAIALIGDIIWSAAVIYKKIQESKIVEQQARLMKIQGDSLDVILDAQKNYAKMMVEAEAEHIQSAHFKENIPENVTRFQNTIRIFAELIDKGAEIKPALTAPADVKDLFPTTKNLLSVQSKIKQIGSGESDNTSQEVN